jgi:DNA-binding NtrC family response regulator
MLKVVIADKINAGDSALASTLNQLFDLECHTLNVPSEILYETSQIIQPNIYILNRGYEGYNGLHLVKKIRSLNPEAIVIMISSNGQSIIHPKLSEISLKHLPQIENINRLLTIHQKVKNQTKPGIKFYERKWCFYRLNISSLIFLIMNLVSFSSLPKANQRILATAV